MKEEKKTLSGFIEYLDNLPPHSIQQWEGTIWPNDFGDYPWEEAGYDELLPGECGLCVGGHAAIYFGADEVRGHADFEDGIEELREALKTRTRTALNNLLAYFGAPHFAFSSKEWNTHPANVFRRIRDEYGEIPGDHPNWSAHMAETSCDNTYNLGEHNTFSNPIPD